jgi:hypothetical protein
VNNSGIIGNDIDLYLHANSDSTSVFLMTKSNDLYVAAKNAHYFLVFIKKNDIRSHI